MINLIEIAWTSQGYTLKNRLVNPAYVVDIQENPGFRQKLKEGQLPIGLNPEHNFSYITLAKGQEVEKVVVVGSATSIQEKLTFKKQNLLLG